MEKQYTIYELCEEMLLDVLFVLESEQLSFHELVARLQQFLLTNQTEYETVMVDFEEFMVHKKEVYKRIMMFMIVSGSYKLSLHEYYNGIDVEANEDVMKEIENLAMNDIISSFHTLGNEQISQYIADYLMYKNGSYLFKNDCLRIILENQKIRDLFAINPYEITAVMQYIDPSRLLESERIIQQVISMYDKVSYYMAYEEELEEELDAELDFSLLRTKLHDMLMDEYHNDQNKILEIYRYILANVYEKYKAIENISCCDEEEKEFIRFMEANQDSWIKGIERYFSDDQFFTRIISCFIDNNGVLEADDLYYQRKEVIEKYGDKVLRKLNPYFSEEEFVFKQY